MKQFRNCLFITALVILFLFTSSAQAFLFKNNLEKARECIQAGQVDKAIVLLNKEINKNPDSAQVHFELGVVYLGQGNYDMAEKRFKKAAELNAEFSDRAGQRYMQSAIESMNKGDAKSAIRQFTAAALHKPSLKPEIEKICKKKANVSLKVLMWSQGYHISETDIQISCLNECLKPKPKDKDGILNLTTTNIKSRFLKNKMAGRLFIIEGEVRNGYNEARSMIHIRGSLLIKGHKLARTEYTYAGVLVSSKDLVALPIEEIRKQTRSRIDPKTTTVEAKQTLPFMIVFSDLPEGLDEFSVDLLQSKPVL